MAVDPLAQSPLTDRGMRDLSTVWRWIAAGGLVLLSGFHLYTGTLGELQRPIQLSVHLALAAGLAFLLFPMWTPDDGPGVLSRLAEVGRRHLVWVKTLGDRALVLRPIAQGYVVFWRFVGKVVTPVGRARRAIGRGLRPVTDPLRPMMPMIVFVIDLACAVAIAGCALYVAANHEVLATQRAGANNATDLWVAGVGIVLILEATRRSVSPALVVVTCVFLIYAFFGHVDWLPTRVRHSPIRPASILSHQYYTAEGVFGVPLEVSATFVFLFVLFGAFLERSGAGQYLIDLAFATMGRFRGGPAKAAVLASGLMGTISGSSIANTVTTGSMTIPLMKKAGFKPHVAGAVEVAASTNGQLMPPVMGAAAFIMAEITQIPYRTIIIAALLPAILSYTAIFVMIHLEARRSGLEAVPRDELPPLVRTLIRGLHLNIPLVAVIVFLVGVGTLVDARSPTTAGTLAIWITAGVFLVVAAVMPKVAYGMSGLRETGFVSRMKHYGSRMTLAMRDGAINMVGIACACACCGIIIGVVTQTDVSRKVEWLITALAENNLILALLLTALTCVVMGIGLPTTATYIIMATLMAPLLVKLSLPEGLNIYSDEGQAILIPTLLASHLFVFYYGIIADDTPPVGLCAYAAAGIAGSDPIRTGITSFRFDLAAATLPLIFFFNHELLLQTDNYWRLLWVVPAAVLGMACFAAALQGFIFDRWRWWERIGLFAVSFLLVVPNWRETAGGIVLLGVLFGLHAITRPRTNTPAQAA